MMFSW